MITKQKIPKWILFLKLEEFSKLLEIEKLASNANHLLLLLFLEGNALNQNYTNDSDLEK